MAATTIPVFFNVAATAIPVFFNVAATAILVFFIVAATTFSGIFIRFAEVGSKRSVKKLSRRPPGGRGGLGGVLGCRKHRDGNSLLTPSGALEVADPSTGWMPH